MLPRGVVVGEVVEEESCRTKRRVAAREEGGQTAAAGPGQKNPENRSERVINKIGSRPDLVGADEDTQAVK